MYILKVFIVVAYSVHLFYSSVIMQEDVLKKTASDFLHCNSLGSISYNHQYYSLSCRAIQIGFMFVYEREHENLHLIAVYGV